MHNALFRKQALEKRNQTGPAQVIIHGPPGWRTYLCIVSGLVLSALIALSQTELHRTVTAHGWITPSNGLVTLTASANGYVSAIHATNGSTVKKGDLLFEVSLDSDPTSGSIGTFYALLDEEQSALNERIKSLNDQLQLAEQRYRDETRELMREIEAATNAKTLQRERTDISRSTLTSLETGFAKGAVPKIEIDRSRTRLLDDEQELHALSNALSRLESEQQKLPAKRDDELASFKNSLARLRQEMLNISQRRVQFTIGRKEEVTAPVSGRLTALHARLGDRITAGSVHAAIVPSGSGLRAELYLPSNALGYASKGQTVSIRAEPFPHEKFGFIEGKLHSVGTVLQDARQLPLALPAVPGRHVFRSLASLNKQSFTIAGQRYNLQPDMRISADIQLEKRKAWEWLLEPLLRAWRR